MKLRTHVSLQLFLALCMTWFIIGIEAAGSSQFETDCGCRPARRVPRQSRSRTARIIAGTSTREGQFPWQASLELLHPSLGFLGHWCGAVLIHQYWILSAAHCVHNDLFNLPIPPLWTVVLGEHDRSVETGYEQRIPVEKIVLHRRYQNFRHDLVLMKLSKPADLTRGSSVRRICLPFLYKDNGMSTETDLTTDDEYGTHTIRDEDWDALEAELAELPDKLDNFLRSVQSSRRRYRNVTTPSMRELMNMKIQQRLRQAHAQRAARKLQAPRRRRNDKLMRLHSSSNTDADAVVDLVQQKHKYTEEYSETRELPFIDCVATGWGKANMTGDLSNELLRTPVPLHKNGRCKEAYGSFVHIHGGHLCAGKLNGKGGTCVGDSGGPLQCRLTKNGPWILAGVTSFGSGCAIEGFPDVYTRTSYYMNWIEDTIASH